MNGTGVVLANSVCNGTYECPDKSDEAEKLCMGDHIARNYLLIVISTIVCLGFCLYIGEWNPKNHNTNIAQCSHRGGHAYLVKNPMVCPMGSSTNF